MKRSVEVTIGGQRYLLRSEGDEQHLRRLAQTVNDKLEEVRVLTRNIPPDRLAMLTALNLADELLRERDSSRALRAEVRRRSQALLTYLRALVARASAPAQPSELEMP